MILGVSRSCLAHPREHSVIGRRLSAESWKPTNYRKQSIIFTLARSCSPQTGLPASSRSCIMLEAAVSPGRKISFLHPLAAIFIRTISIKTISSGIECRRYLCCTPPPPPRRLENRSRHYSHAESGCRVELISKEYLRRRRARDFEWHSPRNGSPPLKNKNIRVNLSYTKIDSHKSRLRRQMDFKWPA